MENKLKNNSGKGRNYGVKLHQKISLSRLFNKVRCSGGKPDVIFMPGCSVTGYNNRLVIKALEYMRQTDNTALYTGCCGKPSKLAGEKELYEKYGKKMSRTLAAFDCPIIVCCQSCYEVLNEYGLQAVFLWEYMSMNGIPRNGRAAGDITLKLPCRTQKRTEKYINEILRVNGCNVTYVDRKCCRAGINSTCTGTVVSCCGECRNIISSRSGMSYHLLDIIFGNGRADVGKRSVLSVWKNRIGLLSLIKKNNGTGE